MLTLHLLHSTSSPLTESPHARYPGQLPPPINPFPLTPSAWIWSKQWRLMPLVDRVNIEHASCDGCGRKPLSLGYWISLGFFTHTRQARQRRNKLSAVFVANKRACKHEPSFKPNAVCNREYSQKRKVFCGCREALHLYFYLTLCFSRNKL